MYCSCSQHSEYLGHQCCSYSKYSEYLGGQFQYSEYRVCSEHLCLCHNDVIMMATLQEPHAWKLNGVWTGHSGWLGSILLILPVLEVFGGPILLWILLVPQVFRGTSISGSNTLDTACTWSISGASTLDILLVLKVFRGWIVWILLVLLSISGSNTLDTACASSISAGGTLDTACTHTVFRGWMLWILLVLQVLWGSILRNTAVLEVF